MPASSEEEAAAPLSPPSERKSRVAKAMKTMRRASKHTVDFISRAVVKGSSAFAAAPAAPAPQAAAPEAELIVAAAGPALPRPSGGSEASVRSTPAQTLRNLFRATPAPPMEIGTPTGVVHVNHVFFDEKSLSYHGLPEEWTAVADKGTYAQFGCAIPVVPRVQVEGYAARIPAVLVQLRDELSKKNGLAVEGVFRVAPSMDDQKAYKMEVDSGTFRGCRSIEDAMCMAALIKEWFRAMPVRVLNALPQEALRQGRADVYKDLPEPNLSVFLWVCDLMAETCELGDKNRMTPKAIAVVVAPNLYSPHASAKAEEIIQETSGAVAIVEETVKDRLAKRANGTWRMRTTSVAA